jgi:DNA-binding LacI/PurR family transcriptional regulator
MTELACNMLIGLINGEKSESKHIALPAQLVIRDSCTEVKNTVAA